MCVCVWVDLRVLEHCCVETVLIIANLTSEQIHKENIFIDQLLFHSVVRLFIVPSLVSADLESWPGEKMAQSNRA